MSQEGLKRLLHFSKLLDACSENERSPPVILRGHLHLIKVVLKSKTQDLKESMQSTYMSDGLPVASELRS
jgi:hypothetical protein